MVKIAEETAGGRIDLVGNGLFRVLISYKGGGCEFIERRLQDLPSHLRRKVAIGAPVVWRTWIEERDGRRERRDVFESIGDDE